MKTILDRPQILSLSAGAVDGALVPGRPALAVSASPRVPAIAFDAFPIFDPRPVDTTGSFLKA